MRRARHRSSELRRPVRWGAVLGSTLAAFVVASASLAGLSSLTSGGPQTIITKRIFPGPRSVSAWDVRPWREDSDFLVAVLKPI